MAEFFLLGPLEVVRDGEPVLLRGARQRALLACLLLEAGRPVSPERLVECIWGVEAYPGAGHSLHELVSKLRRTLAAAGLDGLVETSGDGSYVLRVDAERLDVRRFEALVEAGLGADDPAERSRLLREALALWRGPALAGVALEGRAADERDRLDELRLAATAEWVDAEALLGNDAMLVPELERLTGEHPLHERFRSQLMLALYREGRQADALGEYRKLRVLLSDELGLEPGRSVRDLEQAILRHDPALRADARPAPPEEGRGPRWGRRRVLVFLAGGALLAVAAGLALGLDGGAGRPPVLFDSLRGTQLNTKLWDSATLGSGVTVSPTPDGVRLSLSSHAAPADATGVMKAHLTTFCWLTGAFDVQVDYRLLSWPAANGVSVGIYAAYANLVRESSARHGEQYVGDVTTVEPPDRPPNARVTTTDTAGTLRLTRTGNRIEERVRTDGRWRLVYATHSQLATPVPVYLEAWTSSARFAHREVDVELSDFRVNTGTFTGVPGAPAGGC